MNTLNITSSINSESEIWKPVPGYESLYSVSNLGRIRRDATYLYHPTKQPGLVAVFPRARYLGVNLYAQPGKGVQYYVHRLVAAAFIGEIPKGYVVNHIDGNKFNNYVANLEIVTPDRNRRHAVENGLYRTDTSHPACRISNETVQEIRRRFETEGVSRRSLAKDYGISYSHVSGIILRTQRKHTPEP